MAFKMYIGQQQNGSLAPIIQMKNVFFLRKQEEQEEITSIGMSS